MADWLRTADRGLSLLSDDPSDAAARTRCLIGHIQNERNRDDYISKDFFNVQQTAGGLPEGVPFEDFVNRIAGHIRQDFMSDSFAPELADDDFRIALMSIDENIRRHVRFLNGVVHQAAPGEVHLGLWRLILDSRNDDASPYSCYRDYLVDR
jgi:hypothetical protein